MAGEALKKLEDQLNCSICLDTYTVPKQLQCHHVYCQTCLVRLVVRDQQGQLVLTCPTCRQVTPVPASGVAGLQSAFHINNLLELYDSFKKIEVTSLKGAVSSASDPLTNCSVHGDKELELYCETCGELICSHCALKSGKHYSHDYELLHEAFKKYKADIAPSLEPMEKQLTTINKVLAQLDARCGEISDQREAIEADIHDNFRRLHEVLDVRKTKLIGQLHEITQRKLKDLAVQRDQIETTLAQLSSCLDFVKESLKTGGETEVLMMKTTIVKQVKELTTTFQPDMLKPNTEADMAFLISVDVTTTCQNYGQISTPALPDPSKCYTTGSTKVAVVGERSIAVLQAINSKGQPCEEPIKSSECELVSEITGTRARGSVERRGQSQYEISYQPTIKGRHQLHIKVEGQHIRASPFSVAVKSPVEKLGTPILTISTDGGSKGPWGVAINQRGEVLVTEEDRDRIVVYSPSGKKLQSFGLSDSCWHEIRCFRGLAIDGEGNILAVDRDNQSIHKYTAEGQFLTSTGGSMGSGPLQFLYPTGIAFNATNNKIYVADGNHRVQILNSDLTYSSAFGKNGSNKGQFNYPTCLTCDSSGNVYVADSGNGRIQVFTAQGKFLRMFGRHGVGTGELNWPVGVAIDASNMLYVSEGDNHRISVFTTEGRFVTSFGSTGTRPGQFIHPRGLAVDSSGVVYVCDWFNSRVQLF